MSLAELEDSLAQIKAMLKQRSDIIENLTPPVAADYWEKWILEEEETICW